MELAANGDPDAEEAIRSALIDAAVRLVARIVSRHGLWLELELQRYPKVSGPDRPGRNHRERHQNRGEGRE